MDLVSSANRMYKDKTSEIDEKYTISRDKIYLYFSEYNAEIFVNDEIKKGLVSEFPEIMAKIEDALKVKQEQMSESNRSTPYKADIFTNDIFRAAKLLRVSNQNSEYVFAKGGKHTKGLVMRIIMRDRPFIIINAQPLACNGINKVEGDGVLKIKKVLDFNCNLFHVDLHHLGQTIGRNVEKLEGQVVRQSRKENPEFYLPRLFSVNSMSKKQWDGQLVRNYNLLQCANMSGLLQFDSSQSFKLIPGVISFDIKTAYMSVMINQAIFPGDLTVVDIDPTAEKVDYTGRRYTSNPFDTTTNLLNQLDRLDKYNKWWYVCVDPNYSGDDPAVLYFLKMLKPFRRNFAGSATKLKYVNQDQVFGFLSWDKKFYDEYYKIYTELTFDEIFYNLLMCCPDAKIFLMYSKSPSRYLPKPFRDSKMELFRVKEQQTEQQLKSISKLATELSYGKGLQLRDYQNDEEVFKAVCNETINIAMSLTCCAFTRYRLIHDWAGFTPIYFDSDSIKLQFSPTTNRLLDLAVRQEQLNSHNKKICAAAGYPDSNLGSWNIDGIYTYMMFFKKKCYVGYKDDGSTEVKLAGCDKAAYTKFFADATLDTLKNIEAAQELTIPDGGPKERVVTPDNGFEYFRTTDITYKKLK